MDSDGDDQQEFAKQGGDALNLDGDNDAFNDSEDADEDKDVPGTYNPGEYANL